MKTTTSFFSRTDFTYSIPWNLSIITIGATLFALGIKAIAVHHGFITGGLFGTSLLVYYALGKFSPGIIYFILNIPLFLISWLFVGRRFFYYSVYAMTVSVVAFEMIQLEFVIQEQLYAAIAAGVICGMGAGMILRSLGSSGGLDVIAVMLNSKYNIGIGKFYFFFNIILFAFCLFGLPSDLVIASLILVFVSSVMVEYTLSAFSQRKAAFIVSEKPKEIADEVLEKLRYGCTFLKGKGAYSGRDRDILLTVVNNYRLKRLEEIVFSHDPNALFIVENTFSVIGSNFSKRKLY